MIQPDENGLRLVQQVHDLLQNAIAGERTKELVLKDIASIIAYLDSFLRPHPEQL